MRLSANTRGLVGYHQHQHQHNQPMEDQRWGLTARTWGVCVWRKLVGVAGGTRHLVVKMVMVAMVMTKVMMMTVVMMIFNSRCQIARL